VKKTAPVLDLKKRTKPPLPGTKQERMERREENVERQGQQDDEGFSPAVQPKEEKRIPPVLDLKKIRKPLCPGAEGREAGKPTMIHKPIRPDKMDRSTL